MARFFGRHEHSLDDKGRVILPAKFRTHFEHGGYLAPEQDGCLSLWTPDQFEVQMDAMMERSTTSRSDRNLVRLWASTSHELEIDRQGRMAIPARLREYARPRVRGPGARGDRPGGAVGPADLGREGPPRGSPSDHGRRRLSDAMRLHLVRHGTSDPDRRTPGVRRPRRGTAVLTAVADLPERRPVHRAGDPTPVTRRRPTARGTASSPSAASRRRPSPCRPPSWPSGSATRRRCPVSPPCSRARPPCPATTSTSNVSGPCAVPRPERWENPPPPPPGRTVAALHPHDSCRSRDCG